MQLRDARLDDIERRLVEEDVIGRCQPCRAAALRGEDGACRVGVDAGTLQDPRQLGVLAAVDDEHAVHTLLASRPTRRAAE